MSRCYICDYSPGNQSIYRISGTRPTISFDPKRSAWICSECQEPDDTLKIADQILSDEEINAPENPPEEQHVDRNEK